MLPFHEYRNAGLSVIPIALDKRPLIGAWAALQSEFPSKNNLDFWEEQNFPGIAIVAGAISGNLVCVDVDTKHDSKGTVFQELCALIQEWGFTEALGRCVMERTPSGGWHILFRAPFVVGCEKLARDKGQKEAMIETKGEGGYFVCAPTPGWELKHGNLTEIPTLNLEEANAILGACWALDRNEPETDTPGNPTESRHKAENGPRSDDKSPLDTYAESASFEDVEALLSEVGWRRVGVRGRNVHLCRPGKGGRLTSATLHMDKKVFFVHTSSTEFQERKGYSPAGVYAILKHRGNFSEAAKDLLAQGYGKRTERSTYEPSQKKPEAIPAEKLLLNMDDLDSEIFEAYSKGEDTGIETEWPGFDFRIANNQMTVVTGYPSSGKSTFIQSIAVHLAKERDWRVVIASMEDYPNRRLGGKLIRKYIRKPMYGPKGMTLEEYKKGWEWVKAHFVFVNAAAENITATRIIQECEELNKTKKINALILDPWSEMDEDRPSDMTETDFIKVSLKNIRKFCRACEVHTFVLAHPAKPQRNKGGEFHVLNLYDIAGSHHWRAKADNGFIVRRDFDSGTTTVDIQKVKFSAYGKIGATMEFKFDIPTECYYPLTASQEFLGTKAKEPETNAWWDK